MKTRSNAGARIALRKSILCAVFAALAYAVSLVIHFPVGGFLTLDLKDAVLCLGAMFLGPVFAPVMAALAALLEFLTVSGTGPYGLLMNFVSSAAFSTVAALVYRYKRTLLGAVTALVSAVLSMTAVMMVMNLLITPLYTGLSGSEVAAMIPSLLLPFNLIKGALNASLTALLYKPVTVGLRRVLPGYGAANARKPDKRSIVFAAVAAAVAALSLVLLFTVLRGSVKFGK